MINKIKLSLCVFFNIISCAVYAAKSVYKKETIKGIKANNYNVTITLNVEHDNNKDIVHSIKVMGIVDHKNIRYK